MDRQDRNGIFALQLSTNDNSQQGTIPTNQEKQPVVLHDKDGGYLKTRDIHLKPSNPNALGCKVDFHLCYMQGLSTTTEKLGMYILRGFIFFCVSFYFWWPFSNMIYHSKIVLIFCLIVYMNIVIRLIYFILYHQNGVQLFRKITNKHVDRHLKHYLRIFILM